jgi:hypothetical protein
MVDGVTLREIQTWAVSAARDTWTRPVYDETEDYDFIAKMHRVAGMGWTLEGGDYDPATDFWCGTSVAYWFAIAGDYAGGDACLDVGLDTDMAGYMLASTSRIAGRGPEQYADFGVDPPKIIDPADVRAGDIPVVCTERTERVWGDHMTLARGPLKGDEIPTYAGNEYGERGDGTVGQGVCRGHVSVAKVAAIYRPAASWFEVLRNGSA